MAKGLVMTLGGAESSFTLQKLERSKLYGARRRIAVDAAGHPCIRAALTDDGRVLLRSGMTAQGYFDPEGRQVETASLGAVDAAGAPLSLVPSTLGVPQEAAGADPKELLDLSLTAVYSLAPESLAPDLTEQLAGGAVFRVRFNHRPDYRAETAFVLKNDAGYFALVGTPAPAGWLAPDAAPPVDDGGDDADDLDFEMF